ncbi:LysM peptidoglycan-binding domain-containing protein [Sporosarcina sp. G11-34]|uniref:LysM peptidoglycan-binding domain-containing protein n=1 Tax=Sporosarcina sp. G11-34 TaxID=2849605 RepID=UPI0022A9C0A0|nr:LysM peptidoglycan-binding domain-containing protein [Sporosarcina sp. G11-34]MCZ2257831.1 LysM peptidoglycan-binding domain-containing protein [Sporosarcina sp. G11-34]
MQIHVVQRGQSLYGISQAYGITYQEIAKVNEIPDPTRLVIGQALVIPITGNYHLVRPGESLYSISKLYGMTPSELARINGISTTQTLQVGQRLYIPQGTKPVTEALLYVEPRTPVTEVMVQEVRNRVGSLTYLAMFSYQANRDGSLTEPSTNDILTIASSAGAANAMVISNLEDFQFSADLAHAIFTNDAAQNQLFGNVIQIANDQGFKDIHFDFELLYPEDRELYNNFLRKARDRFHQAGLTISTAVAPKTSDVTTGIYGAHDYAAIGEIVDFVALMTYEWGFTYSMPQAVSPIGPVRSVVEYAVSQIPREKVYLGQNLYGYDWGTPFPPQGGAAAKAVSPQQAIAIALQENAVIQYNYQAQAPFFQYYDDTGAFHEVWFEDARSIQAKFDLMKEFKLRGIMYWKLGLAFPQNWLLLNDNFTIKKIT